MNHHHACGRLQAGSRIWQSEDGVHIDVCGLEPPEPMVQILQLIDGEVAGAVIAHLDREPVFLYPELDDRGWDHEIISSGCEHADEVRLRLVRCG
jgi:hypothetical protein